MNVAESEGGVVEEADPVFGHKVYKDGNGSVKRAPAMRMGKRDGHPVRLVRMVRFVDVTRDALGRLGRPTGIAAPMRTEANPIVKP